MITTDLIRSSLSAPIDWGVFENLVYEILLQDDFPSLRKMGGWGDLGIDAVSEVFYIDEQHTDIVVQITSEKAQVDKFNKTVNKLKGKSVNFRELVIVYKDPVSSGTKREIQSRALDTHVTVDIRDESYLLGQLGKLQNGLYARYFEDVEKQVKKLLSQSDPLEQASPRHLHAMLASIGAFVLNRDAHFVRKSLFDRTVLAALVQFDEKTTFDKLKESLHSLLPGENLDNERILSSLERLRKDNLCIIESEFFKASKYAFETIGIVLNRIQGSFKSMLKQIEEDVEKLHHIDDAQKGRLERNLRRVLTHLMRLIGPTDQINIEIKKEFQLGYHEVALVMTEGLSKEIARTAISSLNSFISDPKNMNMLSTLARSYSAFFLRNLDPLGRNWQHVVLSRSIMVLDTDVVLTILIEELPTHFSLLRSLKALQNEGINFIIPNTVLDETILHISNADRSYRKHQDVLLRYPKESIEQFVWHAVVCGYYYYYNSGNIESFDKYLNKYYDTKKPLDYIKYLIGQRIKCNVIDDFDLEQSDWEDFEEIKQASLEHKEAKKKKAQYREVEKQTRRIEIDVKCALWTSQLQKEKIHSNAIGYLVSSDSAFPFMQEHKAWKDRPKVHVYTNAIPTLAEFICATRLNDDDVVRHIFEPIHAAAAEFMSKEIDQLVKVGVNLHKVELRRLDWDLQQTLQQSINEFSHILSSTDTSENERIASGINLVVTSYEAGYEVDPSMADLVQQYKDILKEFEEERKKRKKAEEIAHRIIQASSGLTKKGKRRVNRILREIGGLPTENHDLEDEDDDKKK